jgi:hypothetical protein
VQLTTVTHIEYFGCAAMLFSIPDNNLIFSIKVFISFIAAVFISGPDVFIKYVDNPDKATNNIFEPHRHIET